MKKIRPLRPQERRLALIAVVLVGCWAFVSWLVQPLWERVRDQRLHLTTQAQKFDSLSELLADASAAGSEEAAVLAYLKPQGSGQAEGAFLNELEALSRDANIELNLKPRPVKQENRISRFEVELDVEGSQQQVMTFLDALLQSPELIAFERLRLSTVPAKSVLRANLVIQHLTLR